MKPFLAIAALLLTFAATGVAQQSDADAPATKADVERYLEAVHVHDMMKNMMAAMSKPMHQMIHDQYLKDKDKLPADFEEHMNKMMDDMLNNMPFDEMMQASIPVYEKHFTKGDMDALSAFYSGPTGQKILREMPSVTAESMQAMMPIMERQMDAINQRIQQEVADMIKNSQNKPGQSPTGR